MTVQRQGRQIGVMVVDGHEIVRRGLGVILADARGVELVGEASGVAEAVRLAPPLAPQIVLVALRLPDGTGLELISQLRGALPGSRFIVLTSVDDDEAMREALTGGASAYLSKSLRGIEVVSAIKGVAAGRAVAGQRLPPRRRGAADLTEGLTPSERRVLELIGEGLSNREIGDRLGIAEKTVKNHITSLLAKMGLRRRTQAATWIVTRRASSWWRWAEPTDQPSRNSTPKPPRG
ncbi:MAG: LuxR C-terminal-related transcriptional regulator [Propionibacterium acidifaciens]|uniref:LuxR C-terminal-related transcriptional regulator n=1 Tax=Propionibacterium acidifaciens TaxID=556499 RepID=UPI003623C5EA